MKTLLVTRPVEQAPPTIKALQGQGYTVLSAPVMRVEKINFELPDDDQSLVVTSQNGVRFGLEVLEERGAFVYAVGSKTASAAKALGFANVHTGPGTAKGLMMPLIDGGKNHDMRFSHLCGEDMAYDIASELTAHGVVADSRICYRMVQSDSLPDDVIEALEKGEIDGVLFHSAKTARGFEELVAEHGLTQKLSGLKAYCFSSRVQAELIGPWSSITHSMVPDERSLFGLIDRSIGQKDFEA